MSISRHDLRQNSRSIAVAANPQATNNLIILHWGLLIGLVVFGLIILFDLGIMQGIIEADVTRITVVIFSLFILGSCHCGIRSWAISQEFNCLYAIEAHLSKSNDLAVSGKAQRSLAYKYISNSQQSDTLLEPAQHAEILSETIRGTHKVGWFVTGSLVKLGLLGTVIGFVMMLSTVSGIENIDVSAVKDLMQQMTQGMGIAMYTTMFGLVGSMLLGAQYLFLDRCADRFVSQTLELSEALNRNSSDDTEQKDAAV